MVDYNKNFGGTTNDWASKSNLRTSKPSHYFASGVGRDSYISLNNGGLYKEFRAGSACSVGTFALPRNAESNLAGFSSKNHNYRNNGTGRDGYIE